MEFVRCNFEDLPYREGAKKCAWERAAPLVGLYNAMFLNNGHQHHFFYHDDLVKEMAEVFKNADSTGMRSSRQDEAMEKAKLLSRQDVIEGFWQQKPFKQFSFRPFGDLGVNFMRAVQENSGTRLTVTTTNKGHIKGLMQGVPVEATSCIFSEGPKPLNLDPVPDSLKGFCNAIAWHQRLAVEASVICDRPKLLEALLSEPTIRCFRRAKPMFDELWTAGVEAGEIVPARKAFVADVP